jgi:abortive infection bacteriophage resistance protein
VPALPRVPFTKPPLSVAAQLSLLIERGLAVNDRAAAAHYLTHIGYYRLSGYCLPLQTDGTGPDRHKFRPGVTFDDVLDLYIFDRKLRLLVMDAVERIEVAIRAALSNRIGPAEGAHWYLNPLLFSPGFDHAGYIADLQRDIGHAPENAKRRDIYIQHYYQTYSTPGMPPSWMVFESVSFGAISWTYRNLAPPQFNPICSSFGLPHKVMISWLHSINYIRNICAHHGRLWNRECRIEPFAAKAFKTEFTPNDRVYSQLVVMQVLLSRIAPGTHWSSKLRDLLNEHPAVPRASMGFPADWESRMVWGLPPNR